MLKSIFNWMLMIGLILLAGRIITAICWFFAIPFTTFFYRCCTCVIWNFNCRSDWFRSNEKTNQSLNREKIRHVIVSNLFL